MSSGQGHGAAGEAELQRGHLRSLPATCSSPIAAGQGDTLMGRDSVRGFVQLQAGL